MKISTYGQKYILFYFSNKKRVFYRAIRTLAFWLSTRLSKVAFFTQSRVYIYCFTQPYWLPIVPHRQYYIVFHFNFSKEWCCGPTCKREQSISRSSCLWGCSVIWESSASILTRREQICLFSLGRRLVARLGRSSWSSVSISMPTPPSCIRHADLGNNACLLSFFVWSYLWRTTRI